MNRMAEAIPRVSLGRRRARRSSPNLFPPLALLGALWLGLPGPAPAAGQERPPGAWWPSEWGAEDERGAANRLTPEKVREASALIREGKVYQLGRPYEAGMPLFGNRHYSLTIVGTPTGGPLGSNHVVWHDEMVSGELGQVGTQFDGLGHVGMRLGEGDYFYNGFRRDEFAGPYGLTHLGVEKVGPIFTRGVLIDVARHRGVERLDPGYAISVEDLQGALEAEGVELHPGDAVLLRTGHGALWMKENETYNGAEPGIGLEAGRWLVGQQVVLVGADNYGIEVVPAEDPEAAFPVHQLFVTRHGIYNLENLDLEELAADRTYEFAFIFSPLRLKGATGSPGNPIAVR
ncbi:MAG: cyclase family protein [Gemmatimonadota bacterium]